MMWPSQRDCWVNPSEIIFESFACLSANTSRLLCDLDCTANASPFCFQLFNHGISLLRNHTLLSFFSCDLRYAMVPVLVISWMYLNGTLHTYIIRNSASYAESAPVITDMMEEKTDIHLFHFLLLALQAKLEKWVSHHEHFAFSLLCCVPCTISWPDRRCFTPPFSFHGVPKQENRVTVHAHLLPLFHLQYTPIYPCQKLLPLTAWFFYVFNHCAIALDWKIPSCSLPP